MALGITFSAGNKLYASDLQAVVDQTDSLTAPGWTSYTPVWSMSSSAPTQGNAVLTGRWRRAANSDLIIVEGKWVFGSTSAIGTGNITMSLPTAASATVTNRPGVGTALIDDVSSQRYNAVARLASSTTITFVGNAGNVTHTWTTWANGDHIIWYVEYEPA